MQLHYRKLGAGPKLVILHGLYGSGHNWFNIANALSDKFTIYLVDLRNHGGSPHLATMSYDEMNMDLLKFYSNEIGEPFYLLGHSMGGKTAMSFTLDNPTVVKKLIVVDISPYGYNEQPELLPQLKFHKLIINTFLNCPLQQINSRKEADRFFSNTIENSQIRKFLLKNLKREQSGEFYWQLHINSIANNLHKLLDSIPPLKMGRQSDIPTLFIRGGKSVYLSENDAGSINDIFMQSKFITFENAGHWLHAEEPERFNNVVSGFLSE